MTAETMDKQPKPPVPGQPAPEDVAFAEARSDEVDQLVGEILAADDWPAVMEAVIGPIEELLNDSGSFEEFAARCAEALARMDTATLTTKIARALFTARLAGNVEADLNG